MVENTQLKLDYRSDRSGNDIHRERMRQQMRSDVVDIGCCWGKFGAKEVVEIFSTRGEQNGFFGFLVAMRDNALPKDLTLPLTN